MRRGCSLALAALGAGIVLTGAPVAAPAQTPPAGQPIPPPPPPPPDLVLSGRSVRMSRAGVVGIRMGCRTNAPPGEACIGSLTVRLANAITLDVPAPGNRPGTIQRRIAPFTMGVHDFTLVIGDATRLRFRLSRRAQDLIRRQERVRVDLIASYDSRGGAAGTARRNVAVYFPLRPEV